MSRRVPPSSASPRTCSPPPPASCSPRPVCDGSAPRHVWTGSVLVFALASALVGLNGTLPLFVVARALQGAACGFIMPAVQQVAADLVGRDGMRAALATIGLPAVIAPAFGPLAGGALVDAVGWRSLFLVNVPVAVLAPVLARGVLPTAPGRQTPLGLGQALPGVLGMVGLLWAVSAVGTLSTGVTVLIAWVAGVLLGVQGCGAWASRSLIRGPWKTMDAFPVIAAGLAVTAVGTLGIQAVGSGDAVAVTVSVVASLVRGLGLGACTLLALSAAYEAVSDGQAPAVGAHTRLMLQLGGALGTAVVGVWTASAMALGVLVTVVSLTGAVAAAALGLSRGHGAAV